MEFKYPSFFWIGFISAFFWTIDFWKLFHRAEFFFPKDNDEKNEFRFFLKKIFRFFIFLLGLVGWGLLSYSLMQPRTPLKLSTSNIEVNDIVLCIDVSRSMLAEDIRPNRLEVAKQKIRDFVRLRPTDRISVVIFSEKVFTLLPLTTDPALVDKVLSEITIGYLGSGTNIGDGLALSVARALNSEAKNKVIVLLTDGVANVGTMTPLEAAEEARKNGIKVYTIGLGTDEDAKIPVGNGMFGTQYQLIPGGSIDYKVLQEISNMTGGKFYPAKSEKALEDILIDIQKLEKTKIKVSGRTIYDELFYQYLLFGIGLVLLVELLRRLVLRDII